VDREARLSLEGLEEQEDKSKLPREMVRVHPLVRGLGGLGERRTRDQGPFHLRAGERGTGAEIPRKESGPTISDVIHKIKPVRKSGREIWSLPSKGGKRAGEREVWESCSNKVDKGKETGLSIGPKPHSWVGG